MSDEEPPIEVIPVDQDEDVIDRKAGAGDVHVWLRTIAAVVAALALVWLAVSVAATEDANDRVACVSEIQAASFSPMNPSGQTPSEAQERIAERAEECGLPLIAEQIRANLDDEEGDN